jgi:mono/diheme cytochrome c family protein
MAIPPGGVPREPGETEALLVIRCLSLPRMACLFLLGISAAGLLAGCDESGRYPAHLRYPLRKDLIVITPSGREERHLPGPGHLEASIVAGIDKAPAGKGLDPTKLASEDRKELRDALDKVFGTPEKPSVDVANDAVDNLQLDMRTLRRGSMHYRRHCLHCHGLAGDGRGPTGPWVHPHPRDYRGGLFKFLSTNPDLVSGNKPRRADLIRTVSKGIESTSMPAFGLLPERELEELVSYVIHLSIRGEVEWNIMKTLLEQSRSALEGGSIEANVTSLAGLFLDQWSEADKGINEPPPYPAEFADKANLTASIARGQKLFLGKASCIACHADYGRQPAYKYDVWGTLVRPANLTVGTYRGGRRPVDIYWRVTKGISPSQMPGLGMPVAKADEKKLDTREIWDLVNFVQALPYPAMLPENLRGEIYGSSDMKKPVEAHASASSGG